MIALVGNTGFVGSNICAAAGEKIGRSYHSTDIADAFGTRPDVLIYAGLRAEKFLANADPEADLARIRQAQENIRRIAPGRVVLISTIDVFRNPNGKDERAPIDLQGLAPYGLHRYEMEQWVRAYDPQAAIIRLPGLYGKNMKKNFLYDFLNVIPPMLKREKFLELRENAPELEGAYTLQPNGFYRCRELSMDEKQTLISVFRRLRFSALSFTDSRSVYQFYPLSRLWEDIGIVLNEGIPLWHPATEPVSAAEVYEYLTGNPFRNEIAAVPAYYDYRTEYAPLFGGENGYIMDKRQVLADIAAFVKEMRT